MENAYFIYYKKEVGVRSKRTCAVGIVNITSEM